MKKYSETKAQLTDAAPELLAALIQAVILMKHTGGFTDTVARAERAISKATEE